MNLVRKLIIANPIVFKSQACFIEDKKLSLCPSKNRDAKLVVNAPLDYNGYYHLGLNFSGDTYPRFNLYVEADDADFFYYYNDTGVVIAIFESDTYWHLEGGLTIQVPLYQPFTGYYTQASNPISVGYTIVTLDWFDSYPVPVVQETTIYLKKYFAGSTTQPADEYQPTSLNRKWSKRIIGPLAPNIEGDTITVYGKIYWDGGSQSKSKILEQKIIVEYKIMFEKILDILKYPEYKQKVFNLEPYKTTAIKRAGNHNIIKNTISDIEKNNISLKSFDRITLVNIWKSETFLFSSKIIITFWWGGLSHNNQAPLFYKRDNLNSLKLTSEILEQYFKNINTSKTKDEFVAQLREIYQALKFKNKKINIHVIKISGINTSFFTKLFQFYFYTNPSEISNRFLPIIADKWSKIAVLADMINNGYDYSSVFNIRNNKKDLDVSFKHSNTVKEYDVYMLFLDYYNQRIEKIKMINRYCNLDAFTLEEYIFGEGRRMFDSNNPRRIFTDNIINNK